MKKVLLSLLSLIGLAQANISVDNNKLDMLSNITEDTLLILEHTKEFQETNKAIEVAYHYSHRSHYSHSSHRSHYSHYSSYDY
jgi:hypothetical protein